MLPALSNTSGIQAAYTDGEYGEPFRYTGRRWDGDSRLYYYRARWYSPEGGRFLQTDPIGYKDDMNLYGYVGNDPMNYTDPTGMCPYCNRKRRGGPGTQVAIGVGDVVQAYASYLGHYVGQKFKTERSNTVQKWLETGSEVVQNNPDAAFQALMDNINPARVGGRFTGSMLLTRGVGKASSFAFGVTNFSATQSGLAIGALNGVYDQMENAGADPSKLTNSELGGIIMSAIAGAEVSYNDDGSITASVRVSKTGSLIRRRIKVEIKGPDEDK